MENNQPTIQIRKMQTGEEKIVLRIMRRAFPLFMHLFFSKAMVKSAEQVLVADVEGNLKAGIVMKTFALPGGGKGGLVEWIFTDPSGRGLGLGARLMDASMDWFDQAGCDQIFAIIEGFNTNSSNLFARRGFSILSFQEQIKRFGFPGLFRVWWQTFHVIDLGHFLWGKPAQSGADSPGMQMVSALLLNMIIALLAGVRNWGIDAGWATLLALPLWLLILLGIRNGLMKLSGSMLGLKLRYRLWETGFVISFLMMLLGGVIIPIPGSYYPEEDEWHYHQRKPQLGKTALVGSLSAVLISYLLYLLVRFLEPAGLPGYFLSTGLGAAFAFSVIDTLLPIFPVVSYNGQRLWDWNRWVWGIVAILVITQGVMLFAGV